MAEPWYIDTTREGVLKANVPYGDEFLPFQPTPAGETANIEELYDFDWAKFRRNELAEQKWSAERKRRQDEARTTIENRGKSDFYLEDGIPPVDTFDDISPLADKRIRSLDEILEGGRERFPWSGAVDAGKKVIEAGDIWARGVPETLLSLGIGALDMAAKGAVGYAIFTHPSTRPKSLDEFRTLFGQYPWRPDEGGVRGSVADVLPTLPHYEAQSPSGKKMVAAAQDIFHEFDERVARGLGDVVLKISGNPEAAAAAYATPHALLQLLLVKGGAKGTQKVWGKKPSPHGGAFPVVDPRRQPHIDQGVGVDPIARYWEWGDGNPWNYHGGEYPNVPLQRAEFVENLPNLVGVEFNHWASEMISLLKGDWKYTSNAIETWMNQVMPKEVAAWVEEGTLDMRINQVRQYLIDFIELDVVPVIVDRVSAPLDDAGAVSATRRFRDEEAGALTLRVPKDTPEYLSDIAEQSPTWNPAIPGNAPFPMGEAMVFRPGGERGSLGGYMHHLMTREHMNVEVGRIVQELGVTPNEAFEIFMERMISGQDPWLHRPSQTEQLTYHPGVGRIGQMRFYEENIRKALDTYPETIGYLVAHEGWHLMDGALADAFTRMYGQRGAGYTPGGNVTSIDGKKITDVITEVLLKEADKMPSGFKKHAAREKIILDNIKNQYQTYAELVPSIRKLSFDMRLSPNDATYTGGKVGKELRDQMNYEYLSEPTELMARILETQLWLKASGHPGNLDYLFMQNPGKVPHSVGEIVNIFRDSYWKDRLHRPAEGEGATYVPEDLSLGDWMRMEEAGLTSEVEAQMAAVRGETERTSRRPELAHFDNTVVTLREAFDAINPFSNKAGGHVFAEVRSDFNLAFTEASGPRPYAELTREQIRDALPPPPSVAQFRDMMRRIFTEEEIAEITSRN